MSANFWQNFVKNLATRESLELVPALKVRLSRTFRAGEQKFSEENFCAIFAIFGESPILRFFEVEKFLQNFCGR